MNTISNRTGWRVIDDLTERQRQILHGISQGKRNVEIAAALRISQQTVKNHVTAILARTGSRDRAQLAYLYARWQEVRRSTFIGGRVDVAVDASTVLSFRVFAPNRLLIRVGRSGAPVDLFELSEECSRELRALLLADIDEGEQPPSASSESMPSEAAP